MVMALTSTYILSSFCPSYTETPMDGRAGRGCGGRGGRGNEPEPQEPELGMPLADPTFLAALQRFGFNEVARNAVVTNGAASTNDLIGITKSDIAKIVKIIRTGPQAIPVSFIAEKRLTVLAYWVNKRN